MFEAGQKIRVLQIHDNPPKLGAPVELIEKQRDGSNGWEHWLVAEESGKKLLRWVTPGSEIMQEAPVLTPAPKPNGKPQPKPKPTPVPPVNRHRLRSHKPITPEPSLADTAIMEVIASSLARVELDIRALMNHQLELADALTRSGWVIEDSVK